MSHMSPKSSNDLFICKKCDFKSNKQCNWDSHITTTKHKTRHNNTNVAIQAAKIKSCLVCDYICNKNSDFEKHNSTAKHKKNILFEENRKNVASNNVSNNIGINLANNLGKEII